MAWTESLRVSVRSGGFAYCQILEKLCFECPYGTKIIVDILKGTTKDWELQGRACILIFNEMPLQENLQYDLRNDIVLGRPNSVKEGTAGVSNTVFVIVLTGIWKYRAPPVEWKEENIQNKLLRNWW